MSSEAVVASDVNAGLGVSSGFRLGVAPGRTAVCSAVAVSRTSSIDCRANFDTRIAHRSQRRIGAR
jgi:hypothetical protein